LNSGPFPRPALPGVRGTTSLSATPPGPACPSRASGGRSRASAELGFPCCRCLPCVDMPLPLPRWDRRVRSLMGRSIPPVSLFADDGGLPRLCGGSAPTFRLSRPAQHSLALRPVDSLHRRAAHLSRRLRRLRYLRRRSDSFRPERPSWPGGTCTRWEDTAFSRRTHNEESCIWRAVARHGLDRALRRPSRYNPVELSRFAVGTPPLVFLSPAGPALDGSSTTLGTSDKLPSEFHTPDPRPCDVLDARSCPFFTHFSGSAQGIPTPPLRTVVLRTRW
jgi:hypothetical protein